MLAMPWDEVLLAIDEAQAIEAEEGVFRQMMAALQRA